MLKKTDIVVVSGGPSNEHEVSLASGRLVLKNLDRKKYHVRSKVIGRHQNAEQIIRNLNIPCDVMFIALHGVFGEDGMIQTILEKRKIRFTGSKSLAARLAFNKAAVNQKLRRAGFHVPNWKVIDNKKFPDLPLPFVIKPVSGGSSLNVFIIRSKKDFFLKVSRLPARILIMAQKLVSGMEVTCGVLEKGGRPFPLQPTEIHVNRAELFDYYAKYTQGAAEEITPARLPEEKLRELQKLTLRAHRMLGCRGMSRSDFILVNGKFWYLETNSIPGLTKTSLFPQGAKAMGISYSHMLDLLIQSALSE